MSYKKDLKVESDRTPEEWEQFWIDTIQNVNLSAIEYDTEVANTDYDGPSGEKGEAGACHASCYSSCHSNCYSSCHSNCYSCGA